LKPTVPTQGRMVILTPTIAARGSGIQPDPEKPGHCLGIKPLSLPSAAQSNRTWAEFTAATIL